MGIPWQKNLFKGEKVRITSGTFTGMEGVIAADSTTPNTVKVSLTIFGRTVSVEVDSQDVERVETN